MAVKVLFKKSIELAEDGESARSKYAWMCRWEKTNRGNFAPTWKGWRTKKKASEEKQQQKNGYIVFSESPSGKLHLFCLYIFFSYHILKRFGLRIECVGVYVRVHSPKTFWNSFSS